MNDQSAKQQDRLVQSAKAQVQANRYAFLRKAAAKRAVKQVLKRR